MQPRHSRGTYVCQVPGTCRLDAENISLTVKMQITHEGPGSALWAAGEPHSPRCQQSATANLAP